MTKRAALGAWLTVLWLTLWGDVTAANVLSGVVVALVVILFAWPPAEEHRYRFRPLATLAFVCYFGWKLVEANLVLAREVLTRRDTTRTGIIAVPLDHASDLVVTIVANAVSLTPGTITLDTSPHPRILYVHVLHLHDAERVRRDIHRLEHLARRALGFDGRAVPPAAPGPGAGP